ncbi:hypothetical protein ColTof3_03884 [Colletotrichum tofieldiae]|nr:hypothetical protein ColTof3_03884 [Colletotrichum tofieldiae]
MPYLLNEAGKVAGSNLESCSSVPDASLTLGGGDRGGPQMNDQGTINAPYSFPHISRGWWLGDSYWVGAWYVPSRVG